MAAYIKRQSVVWAGAIPRPLQVQAAGRWLLFFTLTILSVFVFRTRPAYASQTSQVVVELTAQTDGKEAYQPGEATGYVLTMKNKLGPSWMRIKITLESTGIDVEATDECLSFAEGWLKRGEYYYYTLKAEAYTDYTVVDGLTIPDATVAKTGAAVTVTAQGEAIEYGAYSPDFSKDDPWEGAEIVSVSNYDSGSDGGSSGSSSSASSGIHMYSSPQGDATASTGTWVLISEELHQWKYVDSYGNYAADGWIYVYNPYSQDGTYYSWFHFGSDAIMSFGWVRATDAVWYYTHEISDGNLGMMITGWHEDSQDGALYYMDEQTGIMLSGYQEIGGKTYYFATLDDIPAQTWFWETLPGRWLYKLMGYKSYGSMYRDELTPDGTLMGADGVRKEASGNEEL